MSVGTNPSLVPHSELSPSATSAPPARRRAKRKKATPGSAESAKSSLRARGGTKKKSGARKQPKVVLTDDPVTNGVDAVPAKKPRKKAAAKRAAGKKAKATAVAGKKAAPQKARRKKAAAKGNRPGLIQTVMGKLQMQRARMSLAPTARRSNIRPYRSLSQRLAGVGLFAVAMLSALALFSPTGEQNWVGPAGALLADLSTSVLGYAAYALPLALSVAALALYRAHIFVPNGRHVVGAGVFGLGAVTLLQVAITAGDAATFAAGGLFGAVVVGVLTPLISTVGTLVVAIGFIVAGAMTFGDVVMQTALMRTYKSARVRIEGVLDRIDTWREAQRLLREERDELDAELHAAQANEPFGRTTRIVEQALRRALEKRRGKRSSFIEDYDAEAYDDHGEPIADASGEHVDAVEVVDVATPARPRLVKKRKSVRDEASTDVDDADEDGAYEDESAADLVQSDPRAPTPAKIRRARGDDPKWAQAMHIVPEPVEASVRHEVITAEVVSTSAVPPTADAVAAVASPAAAENAAAAKKNKAKAVAETVKKAAPNAVGANGLRIVEREDDAAPPIDDNAKVVEEVEPEYEFPPLKLLDYDAPDRIPVDEEKMFAEADKLVRKFADFGIKGHVREVRPGPVVTTYEFVPAPGIKVSRIASLSDDIAMAMEAVHVRIVAPIPGKGAVGIEIPNERTETVFLKEIIATDKFKNDKSSKLVMALGKDIEGRPYTANLAEMPHVLISGTTGSGKSVSVNAMICSLLYRAKPEDVKFLMIDPKMLELSIYEGIPHLLLPPIIDSKKAANALQWAVGEMERRYKAMSEAGVRDIAGYNDVIKSIRAGTDPMGRKVPLDDKGKPLDRFPFIVIIIDEYADLLAIAGKDVEGYVMRLAQKARAAGIHVMLATQRPSVDVITGVIKANFPVRMGFRLASNHDSKTIINRPGAEKLLGKGDMLIMPPGTSNVTRVHGAYISEKELHRVIEHLKTQGSPNYDMSIIEPPEGDDDFGDAGAEKERDAKWDQAIDIVARGRRCTTSWLQRQMGIGYNRAARIVEMMEREGLVGPTTNAKGDREIFIPPR